jgi:hypothetical protein
VSTQTTSCVEVRCEGCDTEWFESAWDQAGAPHYPSMEAARADLTEAGWQWTAEHQRCPRCVCRAQGHRWGPWRLGVGVVYRTRTCERCEALDAELAGQPAADGGTW